MDKENKNKREYVREFNPDVGELRVCGYLDLDIVYEDEELPVSAWIIKNIIDSTENLLQYTLGFKALFLHSVPKAENFYEENGFHPVEINMQPLHSIDSDFKAMYLSLREVHMNYDD